MREEKGREREGEKRREREWKGEKEGRGRERERKRGEKKRGREGARKKQRGHVINHPQSLLLFTCSFRSINKSVPTKPMEQPTTWKTTSVYTDCFHVINLCSCAVRITNSIL